jgi:hypothetical protein
MVRIVGNGPGLPEERIEAIERLATQSELPMTIAPGTVSGEPTTLHGWFQPTYVEDAAESARGFIEEAREVAGLGDLAEVLGSDPVRSAQSDGTSTISFPFESQGIPYYGCGAAVTLDSSGAIRTLAVRLPAERVQPPTAPDPGPAIEFVRRFIDQSEVDQQLPEPRLEAFDPAAVLGDSQPTEAAWVFGFSGDRPFDLVVALDGDGPIATIETNPAPTATTAFVTPRYHLNAATGVPDFVVFEPNGLLLPEASNGSPTNVALAFFSQFPEMFGTWNRSMQPDVRDLGLAVREVVVDSGPSPMTHVILEQYYGYRVWGCELRVHLTAGLAIRSISGTYFRNPEVPLEPIADQGNALAAALEEFRASGGTAAELARSPVQSEGLVILPTALARDGQGINHLAWWFRFSDADRFVSADTGLMVYAVLRVQGVRKVWDANNAPSRSYDRNARLNLKDGVEQGASGQVDPEAPAADATMAVVETWWRVMGRNGWDGGGSDARAYVDVDFDDAGTATVDQNAAWRSDGSAMLFSRGLVVPDVVAHEFTHALTQATAGLIYKTESGAINESFSDVFGELIENDTGVDRWRHGIGLGSVGGPIRDLANPTFPNVGRYSQYDDEGLDQGGVHRNSGIGNRAAVLLCDGGIGGGVAIAGIGRQRLARLYWNVLTTRLHPWSTYFDVVNNTWQASRDLASENATGVLLPGDTSPPDPPAFDATVPDQVLWAFRQVELDPNLSTGWYRVPGYNTTSYVFFEGESVPATEVVIDVHLLLMRRRESDRRLLWQGRARASATGTVADQAGVISATITGHGVNTRNKQVNAVVRTTDFSSNIEVAAQVYTAPITPPTPPPPTNPFLTSPVAHWHDFVGSARYGDILYEGASLPDGCTVSSVVLELLDRQYAVVARHRFGEPAATYGGTGARIVSRTLESASLEVRVASWHDAGSAVRYQLRYQITGNGCELPPFSLREAGTFWFGGWETDTLGGNLPLTPVAVASVRGQLDVFARAADNSLQAWSWSPLRVAWASLNLGGTISTDPALTSGPGLSSAPAAVSWAPGRLDVFAPAADNSLQHWSWEGGPWGSDNLGGDLTSAPVAVSWAPGRLDVFARAADNTLRWWFWDGTNWGLNNNLVARQS